MKAEGLKMKINKWQIYIAFICLVLGLSIAVQFKVQRRIEGSLYNPRVEDLTTALKDSEKQRENLENQVSSMREKLQQYEKMMAEDEGSTKLLKNELQEARLASGAVAVEGPGIIVVLEDSNEVIQPGEDPNAFLIHDSDILKVVNELKAGGAEAISVNDQRIIAMSEVRCAGPTILVNKTRLVPPYEIRAIGDPQIMETSLRMPGGIIETLEYWGIRITIKKNEKITIPAYKGGFQFQYAKEVKEGEE